MKEQKHARKGGGTDAVKLVREKWPELLLIAILLSVIAAIYMLSFSAG